MTGNATGNETLHVLLVEDDQIDQMAFRRMVESEKLPYRCRFVSGVAEAKAALAEERFDIIIADYLLGDGTGSDVMQAAPHLPTIIATGGRDTNRAVQAMKAGAYEYVIKDIEREYLHTLPLLVNSAVKRHQETLERRLMIERLGESEERFRRAFEDAPIGMALVAISGHWLRVNARLCEILGYSAAQLLEMQFLDLTHPDDLNIGQDEIRQLLAGEINHYQVEKRYVHCDGHIVWALLDASLVHAESDNAPLYFISQIQDVTERKRLEAELAEARDNALQLAQTRSRFLANMSHEIRTPMNAILGMAELLCGTNLDEAQREFAETIQQSGEALLLLINDILDISKIESGKMMLHRRDFSLRKAIDDVTQLFERQAEIKGIALASLVYRDVPDNLHGDDNRLRQILINLVGNALKFTRQGEIMVRVTGTGENAGHPAQSKAQGDGITQGDVTLRVSVTDSGIGIAPEAQTRIFESFAQADGSTTREFGGTGLGLAICRQLVQLMDGEIGVESEVGKGSTFWFTAQFAMSQIVRSLPPVVSRPEALSGNSNRARLLLVEDHPVNQKVLQLQLKEMGYATDIAVNGREALAALDRADYDLILMDCQMPELDGYEATREIRRAHGIRRADGISGENGASRRIPIVALTAHSHPDERARCLAAGMDDYLSKPVRSADLHAVLERWLASGSLEASCDAGSESLPATASDGADKSSVGNEDLPAVINPATWGNLRHIEATSAPGFLAELVVTFIEQSEARLQSLRQAMKSEDARAVASDAHALHGSSLQLGLDSFARRCAALEHQAQRGELVNLDETLMHIESQWQITRKAIEAEVAKD